MDRSRPIGTRPLAGLLATLVLVALPTGLGAQVREQRTGDWVVRTYLDSGTYTASVPGRVAADSSLLAITCYRGWLATGEHGQELFVTLNLSNFVWFGPFEVRYRIDDDVEATAEGEWDPRLNWLRIPDRAMAEALANGRRSARIGLDERWLEFSLTGAPRAIAPVLAACDATEGQGP